MQIAKDRVNHPRAILQQLGCDILLYKAISFVPGHWGWNNNFHNQRSSLCSTLAALTASGGR